MSTANATQTPVQARKKRKAPPMAFKKGDPRCNNATTWKPGQSGNPLGRLKLKLSNDFIRVLNDDFNTPTEDGKSTLGREALRQVREDKPEVYMALVAKVIPQDINVTKHDETMTRAQMQAQMEELLDKLGYAKTVAGEVLDNVPTE